jgi:hypothetical protein
MWMGLFGGSQRSVQRVGIGRMQHRVVVVGQESANLAPSFREKIRSFYLFERMGSFSVRQHKPVDRSS